MKNSKFRVGETVIYTGKTRIFNQDPNNGIAVFPNLINGNEYVVSEIRVDLTGIATIAVDGFSIFDASIFSLYESSFKSIGESYLTMVFGTEVPKTLTADEILAKKYNSKALTPDEETILIKTYSRFTTGETVRYIGENQTLSSRTVGGCGTKKHKDKKVRLINGNEYVVSDVIINNDKSVYLSVNGKIDMLDSNLFEKSVSDVFLSENGIFLDAEVVKEANKNEKKLSKLNKRLEYYLSIEDYENCSVVTKEIERLKG